MENMRRIINIQAGKPALVEHKNNIKSVKWRNFKICKFEHGSETVRQEYLPQKSWTYIGKNVSDPEIHSFIFISILKCRAHGSRQNLQMSVRKSVSVSLLVLGLKVNTSAATASESCSLAVRCGAAAAGPSGSRPAGGVRVGPGPDGPAGGAADPPQLTSDSLRVFGFCEVAGNPSCDGQD
ncbi:hypothetical protein DPX16_22719 [Anabarilius grahami]|uniref:Uncharacterized protein n=1 Tax=Anabarilius grahami TaxID=495550 RepID=A0A3N0Z8V6_ANAGA|nr:hypothetical protein DPX16_22719 [Anabarilius grahami]